MSSQLDHTSTASFLYIAINPEGHTVIERIKSASITTARYTLELRGYSSIYFHTEDEGKKTFQQWAKQNAKVDCSAWTPKKELESHTSGGAWSQVALWFRESTILWLPLTVWNTLSVLYGRPYGWLSWLGFLLSGWFCLYFIWALLPNIAYQRLLYAKVWAKWRAVRRWVAVLQFLKRFGTAPLSDMHLEAYAAKALAAEGLLEEAVGILSKYQQDESVLRSSYYSELGAVYERGKLFRKTIEYRARAVEANTGSVVEHLDYAMSLLHHLRDPRQARAVLANIADKDMTDLTALHFTYCFALIALEEGNYGEAKTRLLEVQQQAAPYADNILMIEFFMKIKAHLTIVLAKLGEEQYAKQLFSEVKRFLIAHQEVDLFQRCTEALA